METRTRKIMINKAGGNASENAYTYRISLPNIWMQKLGITPEERDVTISFDSEKETITIKKLKK